MLIGFNVNSGSRNTNLVAIKVSRWRSNEIVAMAARMGITCGCHTGIQGIATIPWNVRVVFELRKIGHEMWTSAAHILGEIERCRSQAYAEAIYSDRIPMFHYAILRYFRDASVHREYWNWFKYSNRRVLNTTSLQVQILNAYGVPLDADVTTVILGLLGIVANFGLLVTVKRFGKRKIYLWSMVPTFLSCIGLSKFQPRKIIE